MKLRTWLALYAGALAASALVGLLAGWGVGNALFGAGGLAILVSVGFIGLGGDRKVVAARSITGKPLVRENMPAEQRRAQITTGLGVFALGVALWAAIIPVAYFS